MPNPGQIPAKRYGTTVSIDEPNEGRHTAYTDDADINFHNPMRTHRLAAIDVGEMQLTNGKDAESGALATKVCRPE